MTLNQFANVSRNFAIAHEQLKGSIYIGDSDKFAVGKSQNTPVFLLDIDPTGVGELTKTFKARVIVLGRPVKTDSQESILEVQSDTEQICEDYIALLNAMSDVSITLPVEVNHYEQATQSNDSLAGSFFDIAVEIFSPLNACEVPSSDAPSLPVGVEIVDQADNILATLYPPQRYTVEVLREIIDTITANTATVIDPIN